MTTAKLGDRVTVRAGDNTVTGVVQGIDPRGKLGIRLPDARCRVVRETDVIQIERAGTFEVLP